MHRIGQLRCQGPTWKKQFDFHCPGNEMEWPQLEEGIMHIMLKLEQGLSYEKYMSLYTGIYNHCTGSSTASSTAAAASGGRGANLMGGYLYDHLQKLLKSHLSQIKTGADQILHSQLPAGGGASSDVAASVSSSSGKFWGDSLLQYYAKEWTRYSTASVYINRVFSYLNRHWVKRELDEGHRNIYDVYTLFLVSWRDFFFMSIHGQLCQALLDWIRRHRAGESLDSTSLVKTVTQSFTVLGLDEVDSSRRTLDIYKKYFEDAFLSETRQFYQTESDGFLAANSVVDYLRRVEGRLAEEEQRVDLYLDSSTRQPLISCCESVLIANHKETVVREFVVLLPQHKNADLQLSYSLMNRIAGGLDSLKETFELHVKQSGLQAIEKLLSANVSISDLDPKIYVDALLAVYKTYHDMVVSCFNNDAGFMGAMDKACRDFVNRNALCKAANSSSKSPEFLARFADTLLKKNAKGSEESDIDSALNNIMAVFKYIEDKDVFQKFYSKSLAKRLVYDTSSSEEAEESMINKLKEACGFEYTSRLSRMFTDMNLSKDLNEGFKSRTDAVDVDFYIKVLATGSWPLQPPSSPFNVPQALDGVFTRFQSYYSSQHSGRKLTWLFHLSHGELKTNCFRGPNNAKVSYILMVYTYTMAVLLAFNDSEKLTGKQLMALSGLDEETLKNQLYILLKSRMVLPSAGGIADVESNTDLTAQIDLNQDFTLNLNFKSKKIRINLKIPVRTEQKAESEETHKTVEEDRKLLIQAAIVRIMKTRRVLKHVSLIEEVITQLQARFKPKIPDIKKCIDILLEKEYIERSGAEYKYLA